MKTYDLSDMPGGDPPLDGVDRIAALAGQLVEIEARRKDLEARAEAAKEEAKPIKAALILEFQKGEVQSIRVKGKTVSLRRELWAGALDTDPDHEGAIAALREAGLDQYVVEDFRVQSLSAWVRQQPTDENMMPVLPPELAGKIRITEKFDARVTG